MKTLWGYLLFKIKFLADPVENSQVKLLIYLLCKSLYTNKPRELEFSKMVLKVTTESQGLILILNDLETFVEGAGV